VISPGNSISGTNNAGSAAPELDWRNWILERRHDGAILVRVPSQRIDSDGTRLPDAVFSFRDGDPQFNIWSQRFDERQAS
jgi:hypothetical protein